MNWIRMAFCLSLVATACGRTLYVPVEAGSSGRVEQRSAVLAADTVIVTERCSMLMLPEGSREVTHRELHHFSIVRDTLLLSRTDTIRVVVPVAQPSSGSTRSRRWMLVGAMLALAAIGAIYRIFRPSR